MTVACGIAASYPTDADEWFRGVGTTTPTVIRGTRKFITCAFMAGCAATGTLSVVSPADAVALNTIVAQTSTLPAVPAAQPVVSFDQSVIPGMLQQLRRRSGLSWGEIARAAGVSRRTIHNWLSGARVAGVHLTQLLQVSRAVNLVATGSVESTRTALLQPNANGRSIIDDLALVSRPARHLPISSVSVGDLVTPLSETARINPQRPHRPSSLRGGSLPRRGLES